MLKCPECGGYGKTTSTRNRDNVVIRYHRCDNCDTTFTSTQRVDIDKINVDNIREIIKSDEFRFAIDPLFQVFMIYGNFYLNTTFLNSFEPNKVTLSSTAFEDTVDHAKSRFDIKLKLFDGKANGTIRLMKLGEDSELVANVGTIKYDKEWTVNLDLPTINKLNSKR